MTAADLASLPGRPLPAPSAAAGDGAREWSRLLLALGGVSYGLWGFVHRYLDVDVIDPFWERLAIAGCMGGAIALSFAARYRDRLVAMSHVVVFVGTAHYFSLVARNQIASSYLAGAFVVLASVCLLFRTFRVVCAYSVFVVSLAALVAALARGATPSTRVELVMGVATVQLALMVSARRNAKLELASADLDRAEREVRQLRGLLPICMHCQRIRNDQDTWQELQVYVEAHSDASFTHSLCRECLERHHPA